MKIIIALRGKGSSGKTTTIRLLHDVLLANGYLLVHSNLRAKGDFTAVFSKKNKRVGLTSSGDTYDLVHNRLQTLVDAGCTICVCACRTTDRRPPGTNAAIRAFTDYSNRFVEKTQDSNPASQLITNMADAQMLFLIIESLI